MMKLSSDFKHHIRLFTYHFHNGTLLLLVPNSQLDQVDDYRETLLFEATDMEMIMAIYMNNIKMDENGKVVNHQHAMNRATEWIKQACLHNYVAQPEFEDWETELY